MIFEEIKLAIILDNRIKNHATTIARRTDKSFETKGLLTKNQAVLSAVLIVFPIV
ncbi:hypothetical protein KBB05_01755 [Patescibacteria group bacterium]|nr:hypothetical protein [Patescibacteria group bacterium]